jgi:hypothetical protein
MGRVRTAVAELAHQDVSGSLPFPGEENPIAGTSPA